MSTLRELKSRIGSVASTEKTTSAMKMISSAKMRKATTQLTRLTPYREMVRTVMSHLLATDQEFDSPLIATREVAHIAFVVFGSDDGLCGAFNINIFKSLLAAINDARENFGAQTDVTVIPVGRKLTKAALKLNIDRVEVKTTTLNTRSSADELNDFGASLQQAFLDGTYDKIDMLYMHYISTSRQTFTREQLLPIGNDTIAEQLDPRIAAQPCLFEPDANTIFNSVLPLHLRATVNEVFTESAASEQATRVMAMQTATDNARELLDALNLEYNKLRQQGITTELLDIIGGQVQR